MLILDNPGIEGLIMDQENPLRAAIDAMNGAPIAFRFSWLLIPPNRRNVPADGTAITLAARLGLSGNPRRGLGSRERDTMVADPCFLRRNQAIVPDQIWEIAEDSGCPSSLTDEMDQLWWKVNQ